MAVTFYVGEDNTTLVRCESCQRTKRIDLSNRRAVSGSVRAQIKCPCGHVTSAVLEKRRAFRKQTHLPGTYVHFVNGQPKGKGACTVRDISQSGLKIKIAAPDALAVGDMLKVSFVLDDTHRSRIEKRVIVSNISADTVGAAFAPTEALDACLGFYLRS
jgi:hypothetical protein